VSFHTVANNNGLGVERGEVTGCRSFRGLGLGGVDIWAHDNAFLRRPVRRAGCRRQ